MAGTLTVSGMSSGLLAGQKTIGPLTMTGAATVGTITDVSLTAGDNTIAVPTGATAVLIVIPPAAAGIKARTNLNQADGGLLLAAGWMAWPLTPGTASLLLNATGPTGPLEITFI